jgi:hypothetical protein
MSTVQVPVTRADGSATPLEGRVRLPDGWADPAIVSGVSVALPRDVTRFAGLGFVPNITLSVGEASPGEPLHELAAEHDVIVARDVVVDDAAGTEVASWLAVSSVGDVQVVQATGRWRRDDAWFEVVCSAGVDEWDELAVAYDEVIASASLADGHGSDAP